MPNALTDGLTDALGRILAETQKEWRRDLELITSDTRRMLAEMKAELVEQRQRWGDEIAARLATLKDGERGEIGTAGERGPPGESIKGDPGEQGPPGETIVGPKGDRGEPGELGLQGPRGEAGEAGTQGERGADGLNGKDGAQGEKGEAGSPGERGEIGPAGPLGSPGAAGECGPQGEPGSIGERGEIGPQGSAGPTGEAGARGETGPTGERGERGPEGAPGTLAICREWIEGEITYKGHFVYLDGSSWQAKEDTARKPPHDDWQQVTRGGEDGRSFTVRGTWTETETYSRLDVVAFGGASFAARRDNPGHRPGDGDGWQLIAAQGKQGKPGERGASVKGDRGLPGPAVSAFEISDDGVVTLTNADGSMVTHDPYSFWSKIGR